MTDEKDNVLDLAAQRERKKREKETGPKKKPRTPRGPGKYKATPEGFRVVTEHRDGSQEKPLSNFTARITEEQIRDDGIETELTLTVAGECYGVALPPVALNYESFAAMNWPSKHWGTGCLVQPGMGAKDELRFAIQSLSHADPDHAPHRRTVFCHTGWREIDGVHAFLHAEGAIGPDGPLADILTDLDGLSRYSLPAPSHEESATRAAAASLALLTLAPARVVLPLLAITYLAPLASALKVDFVTWLEGPSQSQKSSVAALLLAHFGAADRNSLTGSWLDTANALEGKLFALKDLLSVVDDYAPAPTAAQQAQLDSTVARVVRSCGNLSGRGRLRADLTARPERPPRGLVLATAEQWPTGESIHARLFGVTLERGMVDLAALTQGQAAAGAGLLAESMANFVRDLASDYEARLHQARRDWEDCRAVALARGLVGRAPEQAAFLMVGGALALDHFQRYGLQVQETRAALYETILAAADAQASRVRDAQPAERFRAALVELLASGAAHVEPLTPEGNWLGHESTLTGPMIGWRRGSELCLLKAPTLEVVNEALRRGGVALNIQPAALWRQLRQRGWLKPGNLQDGQPLYTRKVAVLGKRVWCLVFDEPALQNL